MIINEVLGLHEENTNDEASAWRGVGQEIKWFISWVEPYLTDPEEQPVEVVRKYGKNEGK